MRKIMRRTQKILVIAIFVAVAAVFSTKAFAALSLTKPGDAVPLSKEIKSQTMNLQPAGAKSRAPEPSTIALMGSGLLGMIMSFLRRAYVFTKRVFDVTVAAVGLLILLPICAITALLVKLTSRGPVVFKQTRVGRDGKLFEMYKFRTMCVDAEKESGPVWAKKNDCRITPIGKFLRKTRIDEIPQFVNVIKGDMSIVGPRPERPIFVEKFVKEIPDYEKRLAVKPGITGLAQVWHRYDETIEDVKKKIKYDILYIKKFCFWTDLGILLRTVRVVLTGSGAR